jgi:DNA-binding Lrp family transcriptional regulator
VLPQLADLDVAKLSADARDALAAGQELADGASLADVAAKRAISVDELKRRIETLAAEWREHSGIVGLPKLTDDEYEALRDSIAKHGQIVPILADADGNIIDGRHRLRACRELGLEPRIDYLPASTAAEELKSLALVVNLARRQITASARRGIVRDELLRDASRSDRAIAAAVGVSHPTVAAVRRDLEQQGEVETLSTRVGKDGVAQPAAKPPRDPAELAELPDGLVDVTLRVTREYADAVDGGAWLECRAIRLVLVDAGTYTLEVKQ